MKIIKEPQHQRKKSKKSEGFIGVYFLIIVIILFGVLFVFIPDKTQLALMASGHLFIQLIPILLLIILMMGTMNCVINPKTVTKYVGKGSGIKGWIIAIVTGVLSHGPIYMWYPLLKDLQNRGMKDGLIAVFLYNRAIKIPLLPMIFYYFGIFYSVILLVYMVIASIIEGKIMDMIDNQNNKRKLKRLNVQPI